ncbi:hypothetical protein [Nostoc sp. DedSLP04]|nr:hypothetical protein [Nostoc sp. DedSLP04]MDZ8034035.1 hypothetical protein [Nostoc sp. DedSLP04]
MTLNSVAIAEHRIEVKNLKALLYLGYGKYQDFSTYLRNVGFKSLK